MSIRMIIAVKGSASSGNRGHAGRPGKVGGSAPKPKAVTADVVVDDKRPLKPTDEQVRIANKNVREWAEKLGKERGISAEQVLQTCNDNLKSLTEGSPLCVRLETEGMLKVLDSGYVRQSMPSGMEGALRKVTEETAIGVPQSAKTADRPVYGYIRTPDSTVDRYGDVEVALKDGLKQRTSVIVGDSLGATKVAASPAVKPGLESVHGEYYLKQLHDKNYRNMDYIEAQILPPGPKQRPVTLQDIDKVYLYRHNQRTAGRYMYDEQGERFKTVTDRLDAMGIKWEMLENFGKR